MENRTLVFYDDVMDQFMLWNGDHWVLEYFGKEVVLTWDLSVADAMVALGEL